MSDRTNYPLLPYSYIVGQDELKWILEVDHLMRSTVGGVLISGERGTAKSTIVRSFANMINEKLPVTLPINATDDRVVGGWDIKSLARGEGAKERPGLLQQADKASLLYIDEVNLLDDHIINLILDVASTNVLPVEREGIGDTINVSFSLVGTMNPEEGALRPQLLDRFGLFVEMKAELDPKVRAKILRNVLLFDRERDKLLRAAADGRQYRSSWLDEGYAADRQRKAEIVHARDLVDAVFLDDEILKLCAEVAATFGAVGHRAEIVMARAAGAAAAREAAASGADVVPLPRHVRRVAPHAVMHRRRAAKYADKIEWTDSDAELLAQLIPDS
jgi:magnesium chelatase subunit I